jgi:4-diphosphocytidyl-2-C-methyl-D-erythritol kinase
VQAPVLDRHAKMKDAPGVALRPPAKINLSLVISGIRPDKYHELHTIMATVDLHDDLSVWWAETPGIHLRCTGLVSPGGQDNLVYRAAELLARHVGIKAAVEIHLHKRIPAGSGLGGASSDAAACLLGLNRLWKLNLSKVELSMLAAQLGSDVPFFLYAPVAVCTGRGELVQPLPHRCHRSILLVIPEITVPTPQVYAHYHHEQCRNDDYMRRVHYFLKQGDLDGLVIQGINSLDCTCMKLFEPLKHLRDSIENEGIGPLQISGSGSCLFTTSGSTEQIKQWAQQIRQGNLAQVQSVTFYNQTEPFLEVHHADL